MKTHTFTRQELFDLVWSEPMMRVAARYGISGNGLAKACRKANVPVPQRGYWNKIQAGQKMAKPVLLAAKLGTPENVTITPPLPRPEPTPPPSVPDRVLERIETERRAAKPIIVSATLSNPHRIVAAWIEDDRREVRAHRHDQFFSSIHKPIDKTDLDKRRLRILSAIFKALEARGYKLIVDSNRYSRSVEIAEGSERLSVSLAERIRQVRRELTEKEKSERGYLSTGQRWTQEKMPTGELLLRIGVGGRYGGGNEWGDAQEATLESKLDEVLPRLAGAFEALHLRREKEAEEADRRWKLEQERQRQEMERKRETVRLRRLVAQSQDWETAAKIRAFVAAVETSPASSADPEGFAVWRTWALDHADNIDPLIGRDLFDRNVSDFEVYALKD